MPISDYLRGLRSKVGHDLILVPTVTIVAFDKQQRVLCVRHSEGRWVLPGGSIEPDESPADAAVREMWEETGLLVELTRIIGVYGGPEFRIQYQNGDQLAFLMTVFEGRALQGTMQPDGDEILDVTYFSREELTQLDLPTWAHIVLADVFRDRDNVGTCFQAPLWRPPDIRE